MSGGRARIRRKQIDRRKRNEISARKPDNFEQIVLFVEKHKRKKIIRKAGSKEHIHEHTRTHTHTQIQCTCNATITK